MDVFVCLLAACVAVAAASPCEKAPAQGKPADDHYRLTLAGEPDLYLPGELYTVSLQGKDSGQGPTPFIGFTIWVELKNQSKGEDTTDAPTPSLGSFQAYDAQAKIHEKCSPAVDNATAHPKTEVQVIWNAPSTLKGACIRICARAGPVTPTGATGSWSTLIRDLCAAPVALSNFAKLPPIVEPCCACDEAKYEVTFEGLWSRNTHPREFPPESAHAHFGDVIGASHTAQYRVWQEGRVASPGVRRLADDGTTTTLEKELKAESDHIRTIIKTRGISWQQIDGGGIPNTFAVFRVDAKHHLVSLAAKLAPSPDWIVGVSALELCNANCTWSTLATIPLYPYDAGTDNGLSYMEHLKMAKRTEQSRRLLANALGSKRKLCFDSYALDNVSTKRTQSRRSPSSPAAPVRALRPDWPRDVRSPFFSTSSEMRPFARLKLTRLRLYERSCDLKGDLDHLPSHGSGVVMGRGACATHTWGAWGPCSVSCGPGRAVRQRHYVWPPRALAEACRVPLTDYKQCHGPRMHCRAPSDYEPDPAESSGPCAVSPWSEWSPCEGCGVRARTRHYVVPKAAKRCSVGYRGRTIMSQARPCEIGPCERPPNQANATNFDWFYVDVPRGECRVTPWGDWSPCSTSCGRGHRMRHRMYVVTDSKVQREISRRLIETWGRKFAQLQKIEYPVENMTADEPAVEQQVQEHLERCQFTLTQQQAFCDAEQACTNDTVAPEVCKLPMSVGHCRSYEERWFYEWARGVCEPFGFTGCGGNGNNFRTRDHCLRACRTVASNSSVTEPVSTTTEVVVKKLKPTPSMASNEVMNDAPSEHEELRCEMGPWMGWSECFGDCKVAVKLNYRLAKRANRNCPRVMKSRPCRPAECRLLSNNIH